MLSKTRSEPLNAIIILFWNIIPSDANEIRANKQLNVPKSNVGNWLKVISECFYKGTITNMKIYKLDIKFVLNNSLGSRNCLSLLAIN